MKYRNVDLTAGRKTLAWEKIQGGIFQYDVLSPLLFVIAMMSLNKILRKETGGNKFYNSQEKSTTLYTWTISSCLQRKKKEKQLETLIQTIRIYTRDIGMELSIEKCAMLIMRSEKRQRNRTAKSRKYQNAWRKENYKSLGILEADTTKKKLR